MKRRLHKLVDELLETAYPEALDTLIQIRDYYNKIKDIKPPEPKRSVIHNVRIVKTSVSKPCVIEE